MKLKDCHYKIIEDSPDGYAMIEFATSKENRCKFYDLSQPSDFAEFIRLKKRSENETWRDYSSAKVAITNDECVLM